MGELLNNPKKFFKNLSKEGFKELLDEFQFKYLDLGNRQGVKNAYNLANKYFKDKVDKGGNPYMIHLTMVASYCNSENAIIVGLLHDILEDTYCSIFELRRIISDNLINSIQTLTRRDNEKYKSYIQRIIDSKDIIAIEVKMHDLKDNMNLNRLKEIKQSDIDRYNKYKHAYNRLATEWNKLLEEL